MSLVSIMLVDDHALIREGLRKILELEPDFQVVAEAANGVQAVELARLYRPRIILMDINMPVLNGIEATKAIRREIPAASIIALTIHDDEAYVLELIQAGVSGYVLKDIEAPGLIRAVRDVAAGNSVIHPAVTSKMFGQLRRRDEGGEEKLTERELEVLIHIARGEPNKHIADNLCISEKTVKNHISNIFRKLNVNDRTQAALYAVRHRLVDP